jgi:soluble lytic murein transglycosylase-like protein
MSRRILQQRRMTGSCLCLPILLLCAALPADAQHAVSDEPARSSIDEDFARINRSLQRTADAALSQAPAIHAETATAQDANVSRLQPDTNIPFANAPSARYADARILALKPRLASILEADGMPTELMAVAAVESGGKTDALSAKGARGLWQLMPQTARRYGLVVDEVRDERLDAARSTSAAARYLKDLYLQFGSWPLALAAYNWGEQNLASAISRIHTSDFATLAQSGLLPAETRAYVPAVLARWKPGEYNWLESSGPTGKTAFAGAHPSTSLNVIWLSSSPVESLPSDATPNQN